MKDSVRCGFVRNNCDDMTKLRAPLRPHGVTIIELLIMVAIISILCMISFQAYSIYYVRAMLSELLLAADNCKIIISETYQTMSGGHGPGYNNWGCEGGSQTSPLSNYIQIIQTNYNGEITITASSSGFSDVGVAGRKLVITPYANGEMTNKMTESMVGNEVAAWKCQPAYSGGIDGKFLPSSCQH